MQTRFLSLGGSAPLLKSLERSPYGQDAAAREVFFFNEKILFWLTST